jgi:hypothetical protein
MRTGNPADGTVAKGCPERRNRSKRAQRSVSSGHKIDASPEVQEFLHILSSVLRRAATKEAHTSDAQDKTSDEPSNEPCIESGGREP